MMEMNLDKTRADRQAMALCLTYCVITLYDWHDNDCNDHSHAAGVRHLLRLTSGC